MNLSQPAPNPWPQQHVLNMHVLKMHVLDNTTALQANKQPLRLARQRSLETMKIFCPAMISTARASIEG